MKKFYITTSIAYTNAPPHIGFVLELLQADALARYHRILKDDVFFLTGTDEHGIKVARAAEKENKTPQEFVDTIAAKFKALKNILNLSNNDFIRTSDKKRHFPVVKEIWLEFKNNGDLYKKKYNGLYCSGCEAFITKKDLIDGKCPIHQKPPEKIEEENYFFRLSKYSKQIEKIIKEEEIKIIPRNRKKEMLNFIKNGLEDISFSRPKEKLKWGVPVPDDNTQTIYVWADALVNYISGLGYKDNPKFKKYWPPDVQCIGKDIQKFHAIIWPAMLLSLKLPLPKLILVHGFITVDGQKMSKSLGNVIDPFYLVEKYSSLISLPVTTDALRYFLLSQISPTEDGDFTYEKFEEKYNSDLAGGLGNLISRIITMAVKSNYKYQMPDFNQTQNSKVKIMINKICKDYHKALGDFKFNEALFTIWKLISFCDKYIEKTRPWEKTKNQKQIINDLLISIDQIAKLLQPFLPETSEKIKKQIKSKKSELLFPRLR